MMDADSSARAWWNVVRAPIPPLCGFEQRMPGLRDRLGEPLARSTRHRRAASQPLTRAGLGAIFAPASPAATSWPCRTAA